MRFIFHSLLATTLIISTIKYILYSPRMKLNLPRSFAFFISLAELSTLLVGSTLTSQDAIYLSKEKLQKALHGVSRIYNGTATERGEFPYAAFILSTQNTGTSLCGGTLIASNVVLTAAHCISTDDNYVVAIGLHDASSSEDWVGHVYHVDEAIMHPEYISDQETNQFDAMLLKLSTGVANANQVIAKVDYDGSVADTIGSGTKLLTSGWGTTETSGMSSVLMSTTLQYIPSPLCDGLYGQAGPTVTQNHICAASWTTSTCNGDSGGPLVKDVDGLQVLVGITSYGPLGCVSTNRLYPAVFTKVGAIGAWIRSVMCSWSPSYDICKDQVGMDDNAEDFLIQSISNQSPAPTIAQPTRLGAPQISASSSPFYIYLFGLEIKPNTLFYFVSCITFVIA